MSGDAVIFLELTSNNDCYIINIYGAFHDTQR